MLFFIVVICCLILRVLDIKFTLFRYETSRLLEKIIKIAIVALLLAMSTGLFIHLSYIRGYDKLRSRISSLGEGVSAEIAEWNNSVDNMVNIADNLWLLDVTWFLHDSEKYFEFYILEDYIG